MLWIGIEGDSCVMYAVEVESNGILLLRTAQILERINYQNWLCGIGITSTFRKFGFDFSSIPFLLASRLV